MSMPQWQSESHQAGAASPGKNEGQSCLRKDLPGTHLELSHVGDAEEEEDDGVEEGGVEDTDGSQGEKPQGSRWEGAEN